MLDWENRKKLIAEYKNDLKDLKRQHRQIACKRYTYKVKINGKQCSKIHDDRTAEEVTKQRILAESISSTEYSLFWLIKGYEQPYTTTTISRLPIYKRDQLWAQIEMIESRGISTPVQLQYKDIDGKEQNDSKKQGQIEQVKEIISTLSERERELFYLRHTAFLTEEECAEKMSIALGTVKSMSQRIRDKINYYFEYGHQIDLFGTM
ncbi:sigma factor-like helix-turn-helix DNA-binding protein [Enterococcus sp. LJL128]